MTKEGNVCAGCGSPLTFLSKPNFGAGQLKDGGRVCRRCFARIVEVVPSFGMRSKKDHTKASIQAILEPAPHTTQTTMGIDSPTGNQHKEPTDDPVPFLLNALRTGQGKKEALDAAHRAHERWWAIDVSDREHSMEELNELLELRAFVLGAVATVCVWNSEFGIADHLQPTFIHHAALWSGERRDTIELYIIHLIFQKQWPRLDAIFEDEPLKAAFLDYHDLYRSVLDPHYAFQSKQDPFLNTVNKVNQYCRQIGVQRLI